MVNITHKSNTLRKAIATALLQVSKQETIDAINARKVPKGDVFEFARAAGLLAIKRTSDVIPDCHPLPVEYASITYRVEGLQVHISVEVHTIYKTGVEVEAMHGASVTALVMYDMLKPIDKHVEIHSIRLEEKTGGKSNFKIPVLSALKCAVVVCSDSVYRKETEDISGTVLAKSLATLELNCANYTIVPDDIQLIREHALLLVDDDFDLVLFCGGTGLSKKDLTPEALSEIIDTPIPGIMEILRNYGQQRTPFAMLSRGVAGFCGATLMIAIPGSPNAAKEAMAVLFPPVLHVFQIRNGERHS